MKLSIEPAETTKSIYIFALIAFAFLFSVGVRFTWVYWANNTIDGSYLKWNNEFMVTTNDSYFWAEGARDLIYCDRDNASMGEYYQQNCHQENDLSPVNEALPKITHVLYDILPFSLETIMFYLSAFAGSLLVIPFILIGKRLHLLLAGFVASLIASIGTSYYSRTVLGYYDTDVFNLFFPMLLVWSLSLALKTQEKKYLLLTGLEIVVYRWCYPSSYSLEFAFFGLVGVYTVYMLITERMENKKLRVSEVLFLKQNVSNYQLLSIMLIGMMGAPFMARITGVVILYLIALRKEFEKFALYIFAASVVIFFITGGINPIANQLAGYIFQRGGTIADGALHFYSVAQTIVEARTIEPSEIASKISGNIPLFVLSIIGYAWLCLRQPVMLLMLPLLGIGTVVAWSGGLRFAMYAIPVTAFGMGFFIFRVTELISAYIKGRVDALLTSLVFVCIMTTSSLYPLVKTAWGYRTGAVFSIEEVSLLEEFGKNVSREDYVVTWWDYGYPIRYYSDVKTLIDGAKHSGDVNFPVSFALSHDQKSAANMARLDVEYTEKRAQILKDNQSSSIPGNNVAWFMKEYGFENSNDFVLSLKTDIKLPEKTRDIYFYLPYRMLDIYPTIMSFSHLDLMSGAPRPPFFFISRNFEDTGATLLLDKNAGKNYFYIDKQQNMLITPAPDRKSIPLKRFVVAGYGENGTLHKNIQNMRYDGIYSIVFLRSYGVFLVVNEEMYNSLYFKLFFLEEYDENLFEFVVGNPYAKIYKLKI
ncbi:MAG: peptide transporter [Campylobacteraceae bacterium]|jgi:dolichyl-diphosphooligosaccharide--protein glycosyltransferase/undecaprenyl-diphosphooligosaccharide--protein glycosyltransferase|nr:peptide transporter [Campylobacteraceae bacterium]